MAEVKGTGNSKNRAFQEMRKAALERLEGKSAEEIANKADVQWNQSSGNLELESLGQRVRVAYPSWELLDELDEWQILLLLHYLDMADGAPLSGEWITFGNLKDGLIRGTGFDRTADRELAEFLRGRDLDWLQKTFTGLGARFVESRADLSAEFLFFPRYPLRLNLWLADEEFPAAGKLLVDRSADHYLTIEDAVTAGEVFLRKLKECR